MNAAHDDLEPKLSTNEEMMFLVFASLMPPVGSPIEKLELRKLVEPRVRQWWKKEPTTKSHSRFLRKFIREGLIVEIQAEDQPLIQLTKYGSTSAHQIFLRYAWMTQGGPTAK